MEIIITILAVAIAVVFGVVVFKLTTHPTTGKIPIYYKDKYDEYYRKNFPPFYYIAQHYSFNSSSSSPQLLELFLLPTTPFTLANPQN